jgi:glyoxylase-like metal-dependent hydrolase (beta-lactamase superfamily II)
MSNPAFTLPAGLHVFERGWLSANNILLQDSESAVLIDSGYVSHEAQTLALVKRALGTKPLDLLLNTHLHSDHCGGNHALQQTYPDLQTWIPPGHSIAVSAWDQDALTYKATGQNCSQFRFNSLLTPGSSIMLAGQNWEVHAAPGHDPHAIILFQPTQKILISADALWEFGFGVVFPELEGIAAFHDVANTLDLIESLQPVYVIPGHGSPFSDVARALAFARQKLEGFVNFPLKHLRYGAKVLVKFKLLEWRSIKKSEFITWAKSCLYLLSLHRSQAATQPFNDWLDMILAELIKNNALRLEGDWLRDI